MNEYDVSLTVRFEAHDSEHAGRIASALRTVLEDGITEASVGWPGIRDLVKHADNNVFLCPVQEVEKDE